MPVADEHPGEIPIVEVCGWRVVSMRAGSAYQPDLKIVAWTENEEEAATNDDPVKVLS